MNNPIQYHPTSLEINGQHFPLKVGAQLAKQCRLAAKLQKASELRLKSEDEWLNWCSAHQWSTNDSPALLIEADERALELYQTVLAGQQSQQEDQRKWSQLMGDSVFLLIYESGTSTEFFEHLADEISSNIRLTNRQFIEHIAETDQGNDGELAAQVLRLGRMLSVDCILLHWPTPPLDDHFFQQLGHEFEFQLNWQHHVLLVCASLPKNVRDAIQPPNWPESPEGIADWLSEVKSITVSSPVFQLGSGLDEVDLHLKSAFERWQLIWEKVNRDMATLLMLLDATSNHHTAEAQTTFLVNALTKDFIPGESPLDCIERNQVMWAEKGQNAHIIKDQKLSLLKAIQLSFVASTALISISILVHILLRFFS